MKVPTLHTNGTSQDALLVAVTDAGSAIYAALDKLSATAPNGRDYYPQGPVALREAEHEHLARVQKLLDVIAELAYIADAIADGGAK